MDPLTTAALIQAGGSLLGGIGQGQAMKAQTKAQKQIAEMQARQNWEQMGMGDRQFGQQANLNRSRYMDERAIGAADLQKRLSGAPLADRAAYMLAARAGAAPQAFQARDFTQGGMPGAGQAQGGYAPTLNAQAQAAQNYTAGAGGVRTDALEAALARLQSMAGVPAEYQAREGGQMRLQSEIDEQRERMANDGRALQTTRYNDRINRLQRQMDGQSGQDVASAQDRLARARQLMGNDPDRAFRLLGGR